MINDDNVFAFLGIAIGVSIAALFYARYLYGSVKKEKIHMHLLENLLFTRGQWLFYRVNTRSLFYSLS